MELDPDKTAHLTAMNHLMQRGVLSALYENAHDAVIVADVRTRRVLAANRIAEELTGHGLRTIRRHTLETLLPDADPARLRRLLKTLCKGTTARCRRSAFVRLDDTRTVSFCAMYLPGPDPTLILGITDQTAQMTAMTTAEAAQQRLGTAIEALSDGFVLYDSDDRLVICNDTYRRFYPNSAHTMRPGTPFRDILRAGLAAGEYKDAIGREDAWLEERLAAHRQIDRDVEQHLSSGRWLRIVERATPDGGRVGLRVDITALKAQQKRLHQMAITDELTGLRNRRDLSRDIDAWLDRLPPGRTLGIFHFDLMRFRVVNNAYGYEIGDRILKHCADIVRVGAGPDGIAARIGGNEFLVLKEVSADGHEVHGLAETIVHRLSSPFQVDGLQLMLGATAGVAVHGIDTDGRSGVPLPVAAQIALDDAKVRGCRIARFRSELKRAADTTNDLTRDLQRAIDNEEFEAHFQPQIDAEQHRCIGFEALMRWNHPTRGLLTAGTFLSIAQRAGLTSRLDDLAMRQACAAWRHLIDRGYAPVNMSINLSVAQLADSNFKQRLQAVLAHYAVPRAHIRLELLESTLLDEHTDHFVRNTESLVEAGFQVELDDFGTGHAAIASLRKFKVSQVKIDRSFVRHIDTDPELQDLTGAIVSLAQKLNIETLAEGVETSEEQECLLALGCSRSQGWLYSKALPLSDLPAYLDRFPNSRPFRTAAGYRRDPGAVSSG